jgi:uncharacterized C2H2 Zn-finger protein
MTKCLQCGKKFKTQQGVTDHADAVHGDYKTKDERIEEDMEWANSQITVGEEQDFGA